MTWLIFEMEIKKTSDFHAAPESGVFYCIAPKLIDFMVCRLFVLSCMLTTFLSVSDCFLMLGLSSLVFWTA